MTDDAYRAALTRLAVDPTFRAELDGDTDAVARRLGLSPAQVAELRSLRVESGTDGGPAALDPRLSKSSLFFGSAAHALAHHDVPADHAVPADHSVPADHVSADHSSDLSGPAEGQEDDSGHAVASTGSHSLLGGPCWTSRLPKWPAGRVSSVASAISVTSAGSASTGTRGRARTSPAEPREASATSAPGATAGSAAATGRLRRVRRG
ncbi:hypothetical protein O1M54_10120 [Streptomyces diastatochromogenes]|nr:hypothetical protein [Streptomyces diastatochromogenes]